MAEMTARAVAWLGILLLSHLMLALPATAQSDVISRLEAVGAIDHTHDRLLEEVAGDLVQADGGWTGVAINRPVSGRGLHVLAVDLRAAEAVPEVAGKVGAAAQGAAVLHEEALLVLDASNLRELAVAAALIGRDYGGAERRLIASRTPERETRDLWDPARNRALARPSGSVTPHELFTGAVATLIAHEMHHLRTGPARLGNGVGQQFAQEGRLAQLAWACDDLVDPRVIEARRYEAEADRHAVRLIASIPKRGTAAPRFKYEMGAYDLANQELGRNILRILSRTETAIGKYVLGQLIRPEFRPLLLQEEPQDVGDVVVPTVFSFSHPSAVDRLIAISEGLRSLPGSIYYGDPGAGMDLEKMQWELVRKLACKEARENR